MSVEGPQPVSLVHHWPVQRSPPYKFVKLNRPQTRSLSGAGTTDKTPWWFPRKAGRYWTAFEGLHCW